MEWEDLSTFINQNTILHTYKQEDWKKIQQTTQTQEFAIDKLKHFPLIFYLFFKKVIISTLLRIQDPPLYTFCIAKDCTAMDSGYIIYLGDRQSKTYIIFGTEYDYLGSYNKQQASISKMDGMVAIHDSIAFYRIISNSTIILYDNTSILIELIPLTQYKTISYLPSSTMTTTHHQASFPYQPTHHSTPICPMTTLSQSTISKYKILYHVCHLSQPPLVYPLSFEPTCYTQALKSLERRCTKDFEFTSLQNKWTWTLVPSHPYMDVVNCKLVFRIKYNRNESINK